jgi:Kef-type K+ transport system membrane component KefB
VAVVYAVMVETGLNRTDLGKLILTACFVCDLGTVMALGVVFANYSSLLILLFGVKVGAKVIGVRPATAASGIHRREAWYTTMMISTGLTFGSISALFGLTHGDIDRVQYSILVTVVVLTAPSSPGHVPASHHRAAPRPRQPGHSAGRRTRPSLLLGSRDTRWTRRARRPERDIPGSTGREGRTRAGAPMSHRHPPRVPR